MRTPLIQPREGHGVLCPLWWLPFSGVLLGSPHLWGQGAGSSAGGTGVSTKVIGRQCRDKAWGKQVGQGVPKYIDGIDSLCKGCDVYPETNPVGSAQGKQLRAISSCICCSSETKEG